MKQRPNLSRAWFVLSSFMFVFAFGVAVGVYRIFPYSILKFGIDSVQEVFAEVPTMTGLEPEHFLQPARYDGAGVTLVREERVWPGLTLVSGFFSDDNGLRLMTIDGTVVRHWRLRFSEIFPDPVHLQGTDRVPTTDWNTDIHGALALPDGSVVFNFEYGGTAKLDRCGGVEWTVPHTTHHSIDRSDDGGFWIPGRIDADTVYGLPRAEDVLAPGDRYEEDRLLKISANGEILVDKAISEVFFENELQALLLSTRTISVFPETHELVHLNDIEELSSDLSDRFSQFAAGDLLLSFQKLNLVMVVAPGAWEVKWHQVGPWIRQHDPDFLPDGTISIFNNNQDGTRLGSRFGGSNIFTIDPRTRAISLRYGSRPNEVMYTDIRGKHQNLPNGNVLIVEAQAGRLLEVDADGELVWEFVNRFDEDRVAELTGAVRYPQSYFEVDDWGCRSDDQQPSSP